MTYKGRIIVTGGAGFIMSHFVDLAMDSGYGVIMIDAMLEGSDPKNFEHWLGHERFQFIRGDIRDPHFIFGMDTIDVDYIVHGAAQSHVDRSIDNSWPFVTSNINGTHNLLEWARRCPHLQKFLYVNTDEVYGSIDEGHFVEGDRWNPSSAYAASKAAAGMLAQSYFTTYDLPVVQTYSSNNFGPRQDVEKLIPKFITLLADNKPVPLMKSVGNVRDWIYVDDNCSALLKVLEDGVPGMGYNVAGNNEKTNLEITHTLLEYFELDESFINIIPDRLGHDKRYGISSQKLEALGWSPRWQFDAAIVFTINSYRKG